MRTDFDRVLGTLTIAIALSVALAGRLSAADEEPAPNPYLAPQGLSLEELVEYLEDLKSKPKTIQSRPPYQAAIVDVTERILKLKASGRANTEAVMSQFRSLYKLSRGGEDDARTRLIELAKEYSGDDRQEIADEAKLVLLQERVENVELSQTEQLAKLLTDIKAFCESQQELGERHLGLASGSVRVLNNIDNDLEAATGYLELGKLFAASKDKRLAKYGRDLQKFGNKLALLQKPVELSGKLLDGSDFDISEYQGKVVVIDFWATWCGPCVAELPNVIENYKKYHDQGLEIIGVSLDQDADAVKKFVEEHDVPWKTLFSSDPESTGWKHPMAVKYSVRAIPTMILVGKDGKITALNVRGERLGPAIQAALKATPGGGDQQAVPLKKLSGNEAR